MEFPLLNVRNGVAEAALWKAGRRHDKDTAKAASHEGGKKLKKALYYGVITYLVHMYYHTVPCSTYSTHHQAIIVLQVQVVNWLSLRFIVELYSFSWPRDWASLSLFSRLLCCAVFPYIFQYRIIHPAPKDASRSPPPLFRFSPSQNQVRIFTLCICSRSGILLGAGRT